MNKVIFTEVIANILIGKTIIEVSSNYIKLDNGLKIYLDTDEIELLNEMYED